MLGAEDIDVSTDPEIIQIRRMVRSVLNEINRLKGFTRLKPFGPHILYGYIEPQHRIGAYICDLFATKFDNTIVILGNSRESWISLCMDGKILRCAGLVLGKSLDEVKSALSIFEEDEEEAGCMENIEKVWKVYYSSQFCPERENISAFHRRMPKKVLNSAGLEVEQNKNGVTLEKFFSI